MQVVGQHAGGKQGFAQFALGIDAVVDAGQQHRLVQQGRPAGTQACQCGSDVPVDFAGVVGMDDHGDRPGQAAQPIAELRVDPFRQHDRQAGMDAQSFQVRNRPELVGQFAQLGGGQRPRITATEQDFMEARVRGNRRHGLAPLAAGSQFFAIGEMPAETITAMDGAAAGGDEQGPAGVFVQHARGIARLKVADGIEHKTGHDAVFLVQRQDLTQQWIGRIAMAHASDIAARYTQRKRHPFGGQSRLERGQSEQVQQLGRVRHGLAPELLPAWWLQGKGGCRYHARPVAGRLASGSSEFLGISHSSRIPDAALCTWSFRMATYGMNDVKNGMKIIVDGAPCVISDTAYVKPGKGQAFTRVKYRNIKNGRVQEITMKATDSLEGADVMDTDMEYLYSDGEFWHFMDPTNHEQVSADAAAMADAEKWLKGNEMCVMTLWNGAPLVVTPPTYVELTITETDPGVRGDTSGGGGKPAKLETGAVVRVPLFVQQGEVIKCDTRTGEYVSRVK